MNAPLADSALIGATPTRLRPDLRAIGKEALKAALFALILSVPILSFRLNHATTGLEISSRWWLAAAFVGAVFAARFLHLLLAEHSRGRVRRNRAATEAVRSGMRRALEFAGPLLLGAAMAFPLLAWFIQGGLNESRYWVDLGILILTYVMLGWGLNIVVGLAGLLDLGYVAFYAVGAYSYALLSVKFGLSFWICLPLAGILAAFWGILLGFPVLRLRGDYLAVVTLAFGEIIRLVLINWVDLTNGSAGISSIPRITFFGVPFAQDESGFAAMFGLEFNGMHRMLFLYYLILVLALLTCAVTLQLRKLPVGRAWEALREDEIACRSLGINTTNTKLSAFALGAMFGGFAGSFFAVRQGFVSPESFNFLESAIVLAIVVLGGMGSQIGIAVAAIFLIGGPEMLRNLSFLQSLFPAGFDPNEYRLLLFGIGMIAMMVWRPRGLVSTRQPTIVLKDRKAISGALVGEGKG